MFKTEPETPNTDNGWVYGTVTPDSNRVTSAGRVTACMDCHQRCQPDRVFGSRKSRLPVIIELYFGGW